MRGRGGPPRGGPPMRGGPRGFRGGLMRGGGGLDRGRGFSHGPQGPGPHPVPTIESRGAPPPLSKKCIYVLVNPVGRHYLASDLTSRKYSVNSI